MKRDPALEKYFEEGASWDADRAQRLAKSEKRAWRVAAVSWVLTGVSIGALAMLAPLKRVEPYVIRVDNSTGIVDVVPRYDASGSVEQVVSRYFLAHYVTIRERYNYAAAESDYQEIGAFNSPQLNQEWIGLWNTANPQSPVNVHKDGTTVHAQVKSISFFNRSSGINDLAQVRFLRISRPGGNGADQVTHWIATIQFAYVKPSEDPKDRASNPLGFRVVDYKREPEIVVDAPAPSATGRGKL